MPALRSLPLCLALLFAAGCQRDDDGSVVAPDPAVPQASATPPPVAPTSPPGEGDDVLSGVPRPIEMPAPGTVTPPLAEGADITYTCEDGSDLRVTYAAGRANVTFADGRIEPLPQAQAQAGVDGELYLGATLGLHRIGTVVELREEDGDVRRCRESGGSA